jgi:predicted nucleic acid-binding protein
MEIYIDNCCYCRPYDGYTQERTEIEAIVIQAAVTFCKLAGYRIIGSPAVLAEMGEIRDPIKLGKVREFYSDAVDVFIPASANIDRLARELQAQGLKVMDSYHLAYAEIAGADFLLTTDDRFLSTCERMKLSIVKVINPLNFLSEAIKWAQ